MSWGALGAWVMATLIELVEQCSARLAAAGVCFGHGTTSARDEAAWLVLWRLGLPLDDLDGVAERALSADEVGRVQALVDERIATRKPAAYLTGEAWLQGVPFTVDERAIVPRSLIAEVRADALSAPWIGRQHAPGPPRLTWQVATGRPGANAGAGLRPMRSGGAAKAAVGAGPRRGPGSRWHG